MSLSGDSFTYFRRAVTTTPQQRHLPSLLPRLRQYGGASRASRRFLWRKIRKLVAFPVFAAVHRGDNLAKIRHPRQSLFQ